MTGHDEDATSILAMLEAVADLIEKRHAHCERHNLRRWWPTDGPTIAVAVDESALIVRRQRKSLETLARSGRAVGVHVKVVAGKADPHD